MSDAKNLSPTDMEDPAGDGSVGDGRGREGTRGGIGGNAAF